MKHIKLFEQYLSEDKMRFEVDKINQKFKLFLGDVLVSESKFTIEEPDKWFDTKYATLFELKTFEKFQGKGYAKYLLEKIFKYIKKEFKIDIITLIVDKDNFKALNLYLSDGFEIFMEYDDSYSLIKKL